jgi:hypothetical protein
MAENNGGAAFPLMSHTDCHGYRHEREGGMTLRDYFAGQALAGVLASPHTNLPEVFDSNVAESVYAMADAMLAERDK